MKKTVFLIGGLGNNLFQLAHGNALKEAGYEVEYNTYLRESNKITALLGWSIHPSHEVYELLAGEKKSKDLKLSGILFLVYAFFLKFLKMTDFQIDCPRRKILGYEIGYWQRNNTLSDKYLTKIKKVLISDNRPVSKVVLHVRRGDFSSGEILPFDYYRAAFKASCQNEFIVVTEDLESYHGLQSEFSSEGYVFHLPEESSLNKDFNLMANADTLIMSNSTFCYWASQVGEVKNVIHPSTLSRHKSWFFKLVNNNAQQIEVTYE
jgi:hypothetical protein